MKAVDTNLLELLKKSERFVVPIYQRVYSWGRTECLQLLSDIVRAGSRNGQYDHFTGSIVYIERDQGSNTAREPDLIIDGQQRVTTVTIILAALAKHLETLPAEQREPVGGFAPDRIRGIYLTNAYETGDDHFKLTLTQKDKEALYAVVLKSPLPDEESKVIDNFQLISEELKKTDHDGLVAICRGLAKLVVVDVKLSRGVDDPQLVFESMNATGKRLSQADLIRNFVLMDISPHDQEMLYNQYWHPMEKLFQSGPRDRFDEFVRHYLTVKTGTIPRQDATYEGFKQYTLDQTLSGKNTRTDVVQDLYKFAQWFGNLAFGREPNKQLAERFVELDQLATIAHPFLLRLYQDYTENKVSQQEVLQICDTLISYVFRRAICQVPTNSLNKTFATLASQLDVQNYVESVNAHLLDDSGYRVFPTDEDFAEALLSADMYKHKRKNYLLRKLENTGRKEPVAVKNYSIEHIMPRTLSQEWKTVLGENWEDIHEQWLHTLGNLTLTGYNSEYSNHSFTQKRDMEGGFKDSPLRLNQGLGQLETWNEDTIKDRAKQLTAMSIEIWPRPKLDRATIAKYRKAKAHSRSLNTELVLEILNAIPEGYWTTYGNLAEAVGNYPQPLAVFLASEASHDLGYRVLQKDGSISANFHWSDPNDTRDPKIVLESEGVEFINKSADPSRKLSVEQLAELIEDETA